MGQGCNKIRGNRGNVDKPKDRGIQIVHFEDEETGLGSMAGHAQREQRNHQASSQSLFKWDTTASAASPPLGKRQNTASLTCSDSLKWLDMAWYKANGAIFAKENILVLRRHYGDARLRIEIEYY